MNLVSLTFLIFCVITIFIYFVIPKKYQWIILLISSLIFLFYNNLNIGTIIQALIVLLSTYISGILIDKNLQTKKAKHVLITGILIIVGLLIYLKYTNLFLESLNQIFNLFHIDYKFNLVYRNSLIGISYYSLIMISYLIDIYRGAYKVQKNIFKLALFMSYFPILSSGPFIRYNDIEKNLYGNHKFNYERICNGLLRICWGLFKILVISIRIGYFVDTVYSNLTTFYGFFTIIAALLFTLQLYTNFSGSIDVIMGISEIIGIELPENFNIPFFSKTITEFWRNWHITLGAWLKDYIFYPLLKSNMMQSLNTKCKKLFGKKVGKKIPLYLSMLIMWIIIGMWHGGSYNFIVGSGLLQFIFIFFEDILEPIVVKINKKLGFNMNVFSYRLYQMIRTYLLFSFSMIFFRAESVSKAVRIIRSMIIINNPKILLKSFFNAGLDAPDFLVLLVAIGILFIVEILSIKGSVRKQLSKQNIIFRWTIIYILIFSIIIFGCYGAGYDAATFIYQQF